MSEEVIFRKGTIIITPTMARFGSATYPIAGIGSVFVQSNRPTEEQMPRRMRVRRGLKLEAVQSRLP